MRRFILTAAALVIGLAVVGTAEAGHKGGSGSRGNSRGMSSSHSYHEMHRDGRSMFYYKGREHSHWTYRCWWGSYGCYSYYCPNTCCWYYWYQPDGCYYPCSYVKYATPAYESAPVGVATGVTQVVNVANNSPGAAGAGATAAAGATPLPPPPPGK